MIEDAAAWMMRRAEYHGRDGRIGILGISFGGGLSIVAAGRPEIRNGVAFVLAFGGHADLPRTLQYLCTGIQPDGTTRPPHDYGLAIVLLGAAERVVPPPQVEPLQQAIRSFLEASRLEMVDKPKAAIEFERAKTLAVALAGTVAHLHGVRERPRRRASRARPAAAHGGSSAAIRRCRRRDRLCHPRACVLLHGTDDNVVPAIESTLLARHATRERPVGAGAADSADHARRGGSRLYRGRDLATDRLLGSVLDE